MTQGASQPHPNTIDEHVARTVAGLVVGFALLSLLEPLWWLTALLAADFIVRGFLSPRFSPLAWVAKRIVHVAGWERKPVYAPPKRFAAQVGTVFTVLATALHLSGFHIAALVATAALIIAASLEAFAGLCIACWLYPLVFRSRQA